MSRSPSRRPLPGSGGSVVDALTAPLPVFSTLAVAAGLLALGSVMAGVVIIAAITYVLASAAGVRRALAVHSERDRKRRRDEARRRDAIRGRLERWEALQLTAEESTGRFERAVDRCVPGPLRDRIEEMRPEVARARDRVRDLVALGVDLEEAVLDSRRRSRKGGRSAAVPSAERAGTRALERQRDEVERRAQDIDTSLSAAVAVAFELVLDSLDPPSDQEVAGLVTELEHLREALGELRSLPDPATG